jgi:hypothetical protein
MIPDSHNYIILISTFFSFIFIKNLLNQLLSHKIKFLDNNCFINALFKFIDKKNKIIYNILYIYIYIYIFIYIIVKV